MGIRPFQSWPAHITITQAKELLKSMGEFRPFRECRIKSITVGIFLELCCYGYREESFTVRGFTEDNLICKTLLCWEQIKIILARAMPRALWARAWSLVWLQALWDIPVMTLTPPYPDPHLPYPVFAYQDLYRFREETVSTVQTGMSLKHLQGKKI